MHKEKKNWSDYEDNALKVLKDTRKIQKWSEIAKLLEEQFSVKGKNGKRCRQRYHNHLSSDVKKEDWNEQEQNKLLQLHNLKGNKWAQIAKALGRSDNAVKNHYHSKLRKGIRRINCRINAHFKYQHKLLRNNIISKIVQTAEEIYISNNEEKKRLGIACFEMKNKILQQANDFEIFSIEQIDSLKRFVSDMNAFNRTFKKKSKKNEKPTGYLSSKRKKIVKNSRTNLSAENQDYFSQISYQSDEQSNLSLKKEQNHAQNSNNLQTQKNKKQKEQICQRQQTRKKYQLRNKITSELKLKQLEQEKSYLLQKKQEKVNRDIKAQCKTPNDFQDNNGGPSINFNNIMSLGFMPQPPFYCQYFNYPIYSSVVNPFSLIPTKQSNEISRENSFKSLNWFMIPQNNLIMNVNPTIPQENKKNFELNESNNIIFRQSFVPFKQDI